MVAARRDRRGSLARAALAADFIDCVLTAVLVALVLCKATMILAVRGAA